MAFNAARDAASKLPMLVPKSCNERWSIDFVSDQLAEGRRIRVLNIVDDFSRKCVAQLSDTSISGARLVRLLRERGQSVPKTVV